MVAIKRQNPKAFSDLERKLKELGTKSVKAGWFESSVYPNGTPVAYVAAIQEYGYPAGGIPPRPFMRPTIAKQLNAWKALMLSGAKAVLAGNETIHNVLDKLGAKAAGDVAVTISQITQPPLKPATIAARARKRVNRGITTSLSKPLVDTALLINTVTHVVDEA